MRVLIDYAHADLWESLILLFEDRFGWQVYRPIGMDWYEQGIWQFEAARLGDSVARQFLAPWDSDTDSDDHSLREDTTHPGRTMKMVSLEQARSQDWNIVIATLAENEPGLRRFADEVGSTYGIQVGNQGAPNQWGLAKFALLSVTTPGFTPWIPHVTYHQEFSLKDFRHEWPPERDLIATRVQCFSTGVDYQRFLSLAAMTPEMRWRHYGHCGDHDQHWGGDAPSTPEVAVQMRAAAIGYHVKRWSDGYGHVGFNWFAIGRPVIGSASYYADKLMGPLWVEGVTSFDIDRLNDAEVVELIRRLHDDQDYHRQISEQATDRFHEVVDFDADAEAVKALLESVA